jgi:uncharacterized membrane protein
MRRRTGSHSVVLMSESDRDHNASRKRITAPSAVVWNTVVPALGLALMLGASLLPAIAIAGAAAIAINVVLAPEPRGGQWRWSRFGHIARHRVLRGSS